MGAPLAWRCLSENVRTGVDCLRCHGGFGRAGSFLVLVHELVLDTTLSSLAFDVSARGQCLGALLYGIVLSWG